MSGRAHIEVKGLGGPHTRRVAQEVRRALISLGGVKWLAFDTIVGSVIVAYNGEILELGDVVETIEAAEEAAGVADQRFPLEGDHPGSQDSIRRHLVALSADAAGLGLGVFGRVLRSTPVPVELASLVSVVDNQPKLRRVVEGRLGTPLTDVTLAVGNAIGQGLTQGPLSLATDMAHRTNLLAASLAQRGAYRDAEERRWGQGIPPPDPPAPIQPVERPMPLRAGPVERYSDLVGVTSFAAAATTFATTRSARRAAAMVLAGVPKAARLGREAFVAHLSRVLGAWRILVLDSSALRRLDVVDTVVIDSRLFASDRWTVRGVEPVSDVDRRQLLPPISQLFNPTDPRSPTSGEGWELGPPSGEERRRLDVRRAGARVGGPAFLVLRRHGVPTAVVGLEAQVSSRAVHLARAAHRQGHMVAVAGDDQGLAGRADADLLVPGGADLLESVRSLQHDGCAVALIAPGTPDTRDALLAGDVSVELVATEEGLWAADVVANTLEDAALVIDAIKAAREASRHSVALAFCGAGLGGLAAYWGLPGGAAGRASDIASASALAAMANGTRLALQVGRNGGRLPREAERWDELEAGEVLIRVGSTTDGLSEAEAARRRRDTEDWQPPPPSLLRSVVHELANPLTPVLAAGAGASLAIGSVADAVLVASVSGVNALVGGIQRFGAERAILSLSDASAISVRVRRPTGEVPVRADRLVPGDVVLLQAGDAVPADCRIMTADELEVDESALTGESEPVDKHPEPSFSPVLAERSSMLFEGTTIAAGDTTAVVVAVGPDTAASTVGGEIDQVTSAGGVEARLRRLTAMTLPVSLGGGAAVIGTSLLRGTGVRQAIPSAVALTVASVPEGLPLLATMAQLASARRLSARGALVRNPRAIEALGRTRVLCTDKTGTLTEGHIVLCRASDGTDDVALSDLPQQLKRAVAAGLRATPEVEAGTTLPHLTDRAVVAGAAECGIEATTGAPGWQRSLELPFEPGRGYHAVVGTVGDGLLLSVKGAPEIVIERCRQWSSPTGRVKVDKAVRKRLGAEVDRLARQGLRVLAAAESRWEGPPDATDLRDEDVKGLTLLGFLVLSDPIRRTAAAAVQGLRRAGVEVAMVTGDHPSTAEGIATQLGILNGHRVVTGSDLADMSDGELDAVIEDVSVFARVTPTDKVRIVTAFQRRGAPVAMTGDGANDAPAIKLADVGIAVGSRSSPAARRSADLVVTDERIETIVDAIIEGRAMWTSVREAMAILLGGNLGEVVFSVAAGTLSRRPPLSARQLLLVNLLTDVAPALAIALRQPPTRTPESLLAEGPEASLGRSLERAIAVRAVSTAVGAGMAWSLTRLTGSRRASSTALVALVGTQLAQTMLAGGADRTVVAAGAGSFALLAGIVQTPGVSQFFGCTPLDPLAWAVAGGSTVVGAGVSVAGSALVRRLDQRTVVRAPSETAPAGPGSSSLPDEIVLDNERVAVAPA